MTSSDRPTALSPLEVALRRIDSAEFYDLIPRSSSGLNDPLPISSSESDGILTAGQDVVQESQSASLPLTSSDLSAQYKAYGSQLQAALCTAPPPPNRREILLALADTLFNYVYFCRTCQPLQQAVEAHMDLVRSCELHHPEKNPAFSGFLQTTIQRMHEIEGMESTMVLLQTLSELRHICYRTDDRRLADHFWNLGKLFNALQFYHSRSDDINAASAMLIVLRSMMAYVFQFQAALCTVPPPPNPREILLALADTLFNYVYFCRTYQPLQQALEAHVAFGRSCDLHHPEKNPAFSRFLQAAIERIYEIEGIESTLSVLQTLSELRHICYRTDVRRLADHFWHLGKLFYTLQPYHSRSGDINVAVAMLIVLRSMIALGTQLPETDKLLMSNVHMLFSGSFTWLSTQIWSNTRSSNESVANESAELARFAVLDISTALTFTSQLISSARLAFHGRFLPALGILSPTLRRAMPGLAYTILGGALLLQSSRTESVDLLEESMYYFRQASSLLPSEHPDQYGCLVGLALALKSRFEIYGKPEDRNEAIALLHKALEVGNSSDGHFAAHLEIGMWTMRAFEFHLSSMIGFSAKDLNSAEHHLQSALAARPTNHPKTLAPLTVLALIKVCRAVNELDAEIMQEALRSSIRTLRDLLDIPQMGDPETRVDLLTGIASCYGAYFVLYLMDGDPVSALKESVDFCRKAVEMTSTMTSLRQATARAFLARQLITLHSLDASSNAGQEAIAALREGLNSETVTLNDRDAVVRHGIFTRVLLTVDPSAHIDEAIYHSRQQVLLGAKIYDKGRQSAAKTMLGRALYLKFELSGNLASLQESYNVLEEASIVVHPWADQRLYLLSGMMELYFEPRLYCFQCGAGRAMDCLLEALDLAVHQKSRLLKFAMPCLVALDSGINRVSSALSSDDLSGKLLEAYSRTIALLPEIAVLELTLNRRLASLKGSQYLGVFAADWAVYLSRFEKAIELLEEGRTVFWAQALRLRTGFDNVPVDLAKRLSGIAALLEQNKHDESLLYDGAVPIPSLDYERDFRVPLRERFDKLVGEIRAKPGCEDFLSPLRYASLSSIVTGTSRAVVLFARPNSPCAHAIVISSSYEQPIHVPLSKMTYERAAELVDILRGESSDILPELAELWEKIVLPVIVNLKLEKSQERAQRPRLYWIPTGPFTFLPLHAAGLYNSSDCICAADFLLSSYIPTLSALSKCRSAAQQCVRKDEARALFVAEPAAPNHRRLAKAVQEVKEAAKHFPAPEVGPAFDWPKKLLGKTSVKSVKSELPDVNILHLACHGVQSSKDPLQSSFALADGNLTVTSLMELNLSRGFFAFLSACDTARGDAVQPDEAIHLAATLLFAGFQSVIATMWPMDDPAGPFLAKQVYNQLFKSSKETIDLEDIPLALDEAVRRLRVREKAPARVWAGYVHIGG